MRSQPVRPLHAVVVMAVLLAGLWVLEGLDQLSGNALDTYGIHARDVDGLPEIFTAPLLHAGWDHLASNSRPVLRPRPAGPARRASPAGSSPRWSASCRRA